MDERSRNTDLNAEWVLTRLKEISDRCMQAQPVLTPAGEETGEYRFDSSGANKATELIGRHLAMFTDKVQNDISGSLQTNLTLEERMKIISEIRNAKVDG